MKKISVVVLLNVIIPSIANAEWTYSITDPSVRNRSYSVEEITQSVYNMSLGLGWVFEREFYAPVFKTSENGETKYYKWIAPDLTKYKTSNNEDIFSLTDHGNGSIDFSVVDDSVFDIEKGNVSLQKYYYINSPSNNRIRSDNGTINLLSQDFIGNSFGGNGAAVYNTVTINSITGNFIKNNTSANGNGNGGAIYNAGTIQTITGEFIENRSSLRYGGAIFNSGTINSITGDFVHNSANYDGGVVYNNGTIDSITGTFVENGARDGGVIYNYVNSPTNTITTINSINGNFIHNYATGLGGVISNDGAYGAINSVTGDFIYNSAEYGGAIYNGGYTINSITGDFISNSASERGGAIHNGGRLTFTNNVLFSGNTASYGGAIYNNYGRITMNIDGESCIRFDTASDDIYNYNNGIITVNGTTSGTQGRLYLQSVYNSKIDGENVSTNGTINLNNIHAYLADGQTINQSNLNIDKNSILYAPIDSLNVNNINNKGVISLSSGTLTQNLSHYGYGGNVEISGSVVANTNQLDIPTTNNGILNLNGGNLIQNVSGTGNIVNTGSLFANADKIGQSLINNGTLTLTGGTFEQDITGTGNIIIDGNVTANNLFAQSMTINSGRNLVSSANNIVTEGLTNNGTLTLTGGTLSQDIIGNGDIVINGNVVSNVNMAQTTTINSSYSLTTSVDNIKNTNLNNYGQLFFSSGTLDKSLSNYGVTGVAGTLTANADYIDISIENNGILTLTGGTLSTSIIGNGAVINNGYLTTNGDFLYHTSTISNNSILDITDGTLTKNINGGKTIIRNNAIIESTQVSDIDMYGTWNVGSNTVYAANAYIDGIVNLNIDGITKDSDVYTGGKIFADSVVLGDNSELRLVVTANDLEKGESTGNIKVVDASFWNGNWKSVLQDNAKYQFDVDEENHTIKFTYAKTNEDIITGNDDPVDPNTGNENPVDPNAGNNDDPVDPNTGNENPVDPNSGNNDNPNTGNEDPVDPNAGNNDDPVDPNTGNNDNPVNPGAGNTDIPSGEVNTGNNTERTNTINNMIAVANAWDNVNSSNNSLAQQIAAKLNYNSQYNVPEFLDMLRNIAPTDSNVISGTSRSVNNVINNQISDRLSVIGRNGGDTLKGLGVWVQELYDHSSQSGENEFTGNTFGFSLGADKKLGDNAVLGLGYSLSNTSATAGNRNIDATGHTVFVYGEYRPYKTTTDEEGNITSKTPSPLYIDAVLSYGMTNYEDKAGYGISSEYTTNTLGVNGNVGYDITDTMDIFVGARYLKVSQNDYTDNLDQNISVKDEDVITARFGGRYTGNGSKFIPNAHLALSYDIKTSDRLASVSLGSSSYQISGSSINPFGIQTGFGFNYHISNWNLSLNYDLDWHPEYISHTGRIKAKYAF